MNALNNGQKMKANLKDILDSLDNIKTIDSLYHKEFSSELNFEILDLVQVHMNESNDWDPAELRQSVYDKYKPKQINAKSSEEDTASQGLITDDIANESINQSQFTDMSSYSSYGRIENIIRNESSDEIPVMSEGLIN